MSPTTRWWLAVFAVLLTFWPASARAQSAARTAVIVVEGGAGEAVASQLASHIDAPHTVRDSQPFVSALAARGTRALAPAIGNRALDAQLIARAHAAASNLHVDVAILVAHKKVRRTVKGHLWVIDAHASGAVVDEDLASSTATDEASEVWTAAASLFPAATKETAPKVSESPSPASPPPRPQETASEPSGPATADRGVAVPPENASQELSRANAFIVFQANVEAGSRHMSYVDSLTRSLRPYDLTATPLASIAAEVYPLARTGFHRVLEGFAVTGDYARAIAPASANAAGQHVGTQWQSFDVGVRERFVIDRSILVGANVGYGAIDFLFDKPPFAALLPSVAYRFVRAALDLRAALGDFTVFGGGGYLFVLSAGDIGGLFPRESVGGIEAHIGATYPLARHFELSLALGYTRFFFSMHPVPGDANVAGGALDEIARLSLGLAYLL